MSADSAPTPSSWSTAACAALRPIQKPLPRSPSSQPSPSAVAAIRPPSTRTALAPVPQTIPYPIGATAPLEYIARRSDSKCSAPRNPRSRSGSRIHGEVPPPASCPAIAIVISVTSERSAPAGPQRLRDRAEHTLQREKNP